VPAEGAGGGGEGTVTLHHLPDPRHLQERSLLYRFYINIMTEDNDLAQYGTEISDTPLDVYEDAHQANQQNCQKCKSIYAHLLLLI
jgi:hypothetical protein